VSRPPITQWSGVLLQRQLNAALNYLEAGSNLASLPVYANNAAAISGGLAVGAGYRTASGEIRIVV
jgi:hypothetical protein